jgi:hypothetical protein
MNTTTATLTRIRDLADFVPESQLRTIWHNIRHSEEAAYFVQLINTLHETIRTMPESYATDGQPDPTASLHYFTGGSDWYIIEKDTNADGEGQRQAFGLADIFGDGGELGYIDIASLKTLAEIDLHFKPQLLSKLRKTATAAA